MRSKVFPYHPVHALGLEMGLLLLIWMCSFSTTTAQSIVDYSYRNYGLEKDEENVIQNAAHIYDFFEELYLQKNLNDRVVSIVHIGDSHIQGDYLTAIVRRNFQKEFGNAGRGLLVPARVAGSNDAFNVIIRSQAKWEAKRCVQTDLPLPIGIGGITIKTNDPKSRLDIYMNDLWMDYSFNTLKLFYQKDITSYQLIVKDTLEKQVAFMGPFTREPYKNFSQVILPQHLNTVSIEAVKTTADQNQTTIFGFSVENGKNGVLYHAIGVNGAKYAHYNAASFFAEQTAGLAPQLFIVSLGTNEAISYPYVDKNLHIQIDQMISTLQSFNPKAKFILVTPPDAYRKKNKHNPGVELIRQQIIQYAVENGLAFYDFYKVCGGDHAADTWRAKGLLRSDGVHYTKEGYAYQGNLLFNAIMKSYHQYVPVRHP